MRAAVSGATRARRAGRSWRCRGTAGGVRRLGADGALVDPLLELDRPSILARSASGSRGSRRGRLALTSAARSSAAVNWRRGPPWRRRVDHPAGRDRSVGRRRGVAVRRRRGPCWTVAPCGCRHHRAPGCRSSASRRAARRRGAYRRDGRCPDSAGGRPADRPRGAADERVDPRTCPSMLRPPARHGPKTTKGASRRRRPCAEKSGGVLLSQGVYPQVPSALTGLTSVFGMGTGVTLSLWPPKSVVNRCATHLRTPEQARAVQSKPSAD